MSISTKILYYFHKKIISFQIYLDLKAYNFIIHFLKIHFISSLLPQETGKISVQSSYFPFLHYYSYLSK